MFVAGKQLIGSPLQCMCPAHWSRMFHPLSLRHFNKCPAGGWCEYLEDLCFIKNTFAIARDERIPHANDQRYEYEIGYFEVTLV